MLTVNQLYVKEKKDNYLLQDIQLQISPGQIVGLTGHSGSGKTTLIKSIMGMLNPECSISRGAILLDDKNLEHISKRKRRELCGTVLGFIPQNPMTAFDTRIKIGRQLIETFCVRLNLNKAEANDLTKIKLKDVNLRDVERVMNSYPSQLSGGMLQRVAAAMLLGLSPKYVLADEPTSALDEENRDLLLSLIKRDMSDMGIILISHDIDALRGLCREVYVMEKGKIIEQGSMEEVIQSPKCAWTKEFSSLSFTKNRGEWEWRSC